jgi:hypothetical protein
MTGPFAPAALQVAALHADACTVCELDAAHGLRMSDELLAAHLLVLWSVVDDVDVAHAAVERRGDRSVTGLLAGRLGETAGAALPEELTKRALVGAVWRVRTMRPDAKRGAVRTALRPGPVAKRFIQRAELQLGVH